MWRIHWFLKLIVTSALICLSFLAAVDSTAQNWSFPTNISNTTGNSSLPSIAIDSSKNIHVVWQDNTTGNYEIFYSQWSGGINWSKPVNISNTVGDSLHPAIAKDASRNSHVVWEDNTLGNYEIFYSRWDGISWSKPINISNTAEDSHNPGIAIDSSGIIHIAWEDGILGNTEIFYRPSPSAPNLIEPADRNVLDTFVASALTLQWNHVSDAILYQVQIAKDEKFANIVVQDSIKEPKFTVPIGKLVNGQKYFWRVNAASFATSPWSQTWPFEVNATINFVRIVMVNSDVSQAIVEIQVEKMKKLYGFQMDLFFDPKMLEVLEVKEEGFLKSIGGNTFWKPPAIDNRNGTILGILASRLTPGEVEGNGVLATIRFRANMIGRSVVGFSQLKLADEQANQIAGFPIEGVVEISGLSATFSAVPRIENNQIVLDIQSQKVANVEGFALDVKYSDALELVEGKTHIEGGKISESEIVGTLKFKIWESGEMSFHLINGILKGPSGITGPPTLLDGKITVVASPAWDVNKNYIIDIFDMVILGTNLDAKIVGKPRPNPDVTGDGIVDLFDFVKVGANFGASYSARPGVGASPIIAEQYFKALSKDLAYQYLPLWQKLHADLEKNVSTSVEFAKTKLLLQELIALVDRIILMQTNLMQNYPNPFNPETWIPYQLSNSSDVIIKIYDISGRIVRTLNLGWKDAGSYMTKGRAAYWDGKNDAGEYVSSGIYFYELSDGSFKSIKKMGVLK